VNEAILAAQLDILVLQVKLALLALYRDLPELLDQQVQPALRPTQVLLVLQAQRLIYLVLQVLQVLDLQVLQVLEVSLVQLVSPVQQAVLLVTKDLRVIRV
jgi:hypothetical protein